MPRPARQRGVAARIVAPQVAPVAAEKLVAAHAGEDHLHVAARELRHQIGGDEGRVGQRLVQVPHQPRQQAHDIGLDDDLVVLGAEQPRHLARVGQLVVQLLCGATLEADGIGLDRPRRMARHRRHHRARVDAAGQEGTDRHIGHHLAVHGAVDAAAHALGPFGVVGCGVRARGQAPPAPLPNLPVLHRQQRGRRQLADAGKDAGRRRHVAQVQVVGQHRAVEFDALAGQLQQRLGFGGESQAARRLRHVGAA